MNLQTTKLWVNLNSAPNPDVLMFGSLGAIEGEAFKDVENVYFAVDTLEEASKVCRRYIEYFNLGSGNWTGGNVVDETGRFVARISFNGRIWFEKDKLA